MGLTLFSDVMPGAINSDLSMICAFIIVLLPAEVLKLPIYVFVIFLKFWQTLGLLHCG